MNFFKKLKKKLKFFNRIISADTFSESEFYADHAGHVYITLARHLRGAVLGFQWILLFFSTFFCKNI